MSGILGTSDNQDGVDGFTRAADKNGVFGRNDPSPTNPDALAIEPGGNGVFGFSMIKGGAGVFGTNNRTDSGRGVQGNGPDAGVGGFSMTGSGVLAQSVSGNGVLAESNSGDGIDGLTRAPDKNGVFGRNDPSPTNPNAPAIEPGGNGVFGFSMVKGGAGVFGANNRTDSGRGVQGNGAEAGVGGFSMTGVGVLGQSGTNDGVRGTSATGVGLCGLHGPSAFLDVARAFAPNAGVVGTSDGDVGVVGVSWTPGKPGVFGFGGVAGFGDTRRPAGSFLGRVVIVGDLQVSGGNKQFVIDHPLDPEKKYLRHAAVESPEIKTVYDGATELDALGAAVIALPDWLEALNGDFRYQLTAVGGAAPNLHIAREVHCNRFEIAGGTANLKVCWQITGVRHDPSARAHPLIVEDDKPADERGYFLQPELYGQPAERGLDRGENLHLIRRMERLAGPLGQCTEEHSKV